MGWNPCPAHNTHKSSAARRSARETRTATFGGMDSHTFMSHDQRRLSERNTTASNRYSTSQSLAGGFEIIAGLGNSGCHRFFGFFEISSWVIQFFAAHLAVDFQNRIVVTEYVICNGTGKGVLVVCIDVHLDDAILSP